MLYFNGELYRKGLIIKIIELTEAENDEVNSILLTWTIDSIHSQLGLFASRV